MDLENRKNARIDVFAFLKVVEQKGGNIHTARMFNFSKDGLYFESDSLLKVGTLVFIIVEESPYVSAEGILKFYRARIVWQKDLTGSFFNYGYGIRFVSLSEIQELRPQRIPEKKELRRHPRKAFTKSLRFATVHWIYKGITKNISSSGIFIATEDELEPGQTIKMVLPLKNGEQARITARVVWVNEKGFGARFLKIS